MTARPGGNVWRGLLVWLPLGAALDVASFGLLARRLALTQPAWLLTLVLAWALATIALGRLLLAGASGPAIAARSALRRGQLPPPEELEAVLRVYGALAWMLPGPLADLCGLALTLGPTRRRLAGWLWRRLRLRLEPNVVDAALVELKPPALGRGRETR